MNILANSSNLVSSGQSYQAHFSNNNKNGSTSASAGFTLLQGHIQLMAMVPNLPENQLSPRWKGSSDDAEEDSTIDPKQSSLSSMYHE